MIADSAVLVDAAMLEKIILAKQVGQFLCKDHSSEERASIESVARKLASDVSKQVREVLAYELRRCEELVPDLAEKIAKDIETVAGPFLEESKAFSPAMLVRLIPELKDFARAAIARRVDISNDVVEALIESAEEKSVTCLVRNDRINLQQNACKVVVRRFQDNVRVMDQLSARADLPIFIIEKIVNKVSTHCRNMLIEEYDVDMGMANEVASTVKLEALWRRIKGATDAQIHGYVTDLRDARKLRHDTALKMAEKGCLAFLESTLALEAGLPLGRVKEILTLVDQAAFVRMMQMANVSRKLAPQFLKLAKEHYSFTINQAA